MDEASARTLLKTDTTSILPKVLVRMLSRKAVRIVITVTKWTGTGLNLTKKVSVMDEASTRTLLKAETTSILPKVLVRMLS